MAGDPERKRKKKSGRGQGKSCGNIYPAEPTSSLGLLARVSSTVSSSRGVRPACGAAQPFSNQTPQGRRHGRDLIQSRALEGGNAKLLPAPAAAVAASWARSAQSRGIFGSPNRPPPRLLPRSLLSCRGPQAPPGEGALPHPPRPAPPGHGRQRRHGQLRALVEIANQQQKEKQGSRGRGAAARPTCPRGARAARAAQRGLD
ncbi:proline-rich protein 15 isoform X1 [Hyaena hyaena]|uniref:proline-rich protein 15 isoform X1 n=1 Tax=Hyaena hyaena TaxID=95912 RepID=UPI001921D79C|nr:proline-rich protein 15 isoform X1 [Hyaena hyaena]